MTHNRPYPGTVRYITNQDPRPLCLYGATMWMISRLGNAGIFSFEEMVRNHNHPRNPLPCSPRPRLFSPGKNSLNPARRIANHLPPRRPAVARLSARSPILRNRLPLGINTRLPSFCFFFFFFWGRGFFFFFFSFFREEEVEL